MTSYSTPLIALDVVVLDTETTGLDARTALVIQIGALKLTAGEPSDVAPFDALIDPGVPVPATATRVHGITTAMLAGKPRFDKIAADLTAYVGERIVVGHTIGYDLAVLSRAYSTAGLKMPRWRALDIRTLARLVAPMLANHSLEQLCDWLGITIEGRHTALGDAHASAAVFRALLPRLRDKGVRTLAEAEAASRVLLDNDVVSGARPYAIDAPPAPVLQKLDSFAYRTRIADVMTSPPLTVLPQTLLGDVMRRLIETGASSVFSRRADGMDGIVTERDILRAIARDGASVLASPAEAFIQTPLQTVRDSDHLYRALGRMSRLGIRHLAVVDAAGAIVGAVTTRNLLKHRAGAASALGDAIDTASGAPELAAAWARLAPMARSLMSDDVEARDICGVVSAEICAMTARAAALAVDAMAAAGKGAPPSPFAVMVLGSAARGESQLAADQDNAIVYAEGEEGGDIDRWFAEMATIMSDILDAASVPLCKGGIMAKNRAWRQSSADWIAAIDGWVRRQRPEDLLAVDIFFDAVPVFGAFDLADSLRDHAYRYAHASRRFQNLLTENARGPASPFTLFGGIRTDEKRRLDIKRYGLMTLFTSARVLSIRHDIRERSSAARMRGVAAAGHGNSDEIDGIIAAQETLLGLVLGQQLIDIETGVPPSTRVDIDRLSVAEKAELKEALTATATAAALVAEGHE